MELLNQLKRQIGFIQRSCVDYDNGNKDEALRLAVAMRVLFHDTNNSISLTKQLGIKDTIHLLSTMSIEIPDFGGSEDYKYSHIIYIPMMLTIGGVNPPLGESDTKKILTVDEWWHDTIMIQHNSISRRDIILSAANQDGGAHVDNNPSNKTKELKEGVGTISITFGGQTKVEKLSNHHFPLLRQFGYELLNSNELISLIST